MTYMVSKKTVDQILLVLNNYMPQEQISLVLKDLQMVEGNKSFTDTVKALRESHAAKIRRKLPRS
jgi:hypothetical protein